MLVVCCLCTEAVLDIIDPLSSTPSLVGFLHRPASYLSVAADGIRVLPSSSLVVYVPLEPLGTSVSITYLAVRSMLQSSSPRPRSIMQSGSLSFHSAQSLAPPRMKHNQTTNLRLHAYSGKYLLSDREQIVGWPACLLHFYEDKPGP
jgi:hypothetical protein